MSNGSLDSGARYLIEGFKWLKHPRVRPFVAVPLVVNIIIFASLITWALTGLMAWMESFMAWLPDWLSFLDWILWPLLVLGGLLVSGYLFTMVAILILSPFNALLAEKIEEEITGREVPGLEGFAAALKSFPRSLGRELAKLAYYLPLVLGIAILSFIPPFSLVAPLLWFLLGAWMMSVQYCDYPMDNHQFSFSAVKQRLRRRRMTALGFGGLVSLMSSIPILNFFVVPAAVCGATVFWVRELGQEHHPKG